MTRDNLARNFIIVNYSYFSTNIGQQVQEVYPAANSAHGMQVAWKPAGLKAQGDGWTWNWALTGWGRAGNKVSIMGDYSPTGVECTPTTWRIMLEVRPTAKN